MHVSLTKYILNKANCSPFRHPPLLVWTMARVALLASAALLSFAAVACTLSRQMTATRQSSKMCARIEWQSRTPLPYTTYVCLLPVHCGSSYNGSDPQRITPHQLRRGLRAASSSAHLQTSARSCVSFLAPFHTYPQPL